MDFYPDDFRFIRLHYMCLFAMLHCFHDAKWISRHPTICRMRFGTATKVKNIEFHEKIWKSLIVSVHWRFLLRGQENSFEDGNDLALCVFWIIEIEKSIQLQTCLFSDFYYKFHGITLDNAIYFVFMM
ncbi:uncharacterized protein LOC111639765 [Centruroides sculpturatus]|uniref:uncharacterized protein LOC111639765 n=1 Tax=Centruroides sculpturatus TaxID=218467 RepID=UPI000C6DA134|nr:uncharacterized protein LOC111639765 [Centruroides sculpturatus]